MSEDRKRKQIFEVRTEGKKIECKNYKSWKEKGKVYKK